MINLNIDCKELAIIDIKKRDLSGMLKWYGATEKYKYVTGSDRPLLLRELEEIYYKAAYGAKEFYAGIRFKKNQNMIGFVRGCVKQEMAGAMWLNSIVIDEEYQNQGYGSMALENIIKYFGNLYEINKVFISVAVHNIDGIRFWYKNGFRTLETVEGISGVHLKDHNTILMERKI